MLTLELSSYALEIPNDFDTTPQLKSAAQYSIKELAS